MSQTTRFSLHETPTYFKSKRFGEAIDAQPLSNIDNQVTFVDELADSHFFDLWCVFGYLHFSHSDFDKNICQMNLGNAKHLRR
jgi:hypothetical protein